MLYPTKGLCESREPKVVQLFLLMFYFCVRKRILDFQFTGENSPFWNLENVLSPEGNLRKQTRRGPLDSLSILLWSRKRFLMFNSIHWKKSDPACAEKRVGKGFWRFVSVAVIRLFKILKMFYPLKGLCKAEHIGVHLTAFPFYCVRKGCLDLSF